MEQFAVDTISAGGALGVLFVLFLLAFGWCYFRIKGHDVRDTGDTGLCKIGDNVTYYGTYRDIEIVKTL